MISAPASPGRQHRLRLARRLARARGLWGLRGGLRHEASVAVWI